jgi:alginate O-acetyltransferase complex protein AlgI
LTFNSLSFAIFFVIVLLLCAVAPKLKVWILLLASFVFYSWISWYFGVILFAMSVFGYVFPFIARPSAPRTYRIATLAFCILAILSPLLLLKYWNFAADSLQQLAAAGGLTIALLHIAQPIPPGISFHSFQLIAYVVDVFRGRAPPERRPGIFFLFSSFFPQLVSGPIERPNHLIPQLPDAGLVTRENAASAFQLFLYGLFLKVAIADVVAIKVDQIYAAPEAQGGAMLFAATVLFYIQIYCDFGGYSMMALGVARALGVHLVQNFNAPIVAASLTDFWHRWHISLSTWFRDYVYIPLGGNRSGLARWMIAILATFLLSGLWHGANWTFIVWGGLHGAGLVVTVVFARLLPSVGRLPGAVLLGWLVTQLFVTVTWIFFRAETVTKAWAIVSAIARDFLVTGQGWPDLLMVPAKLGVPVGAVLAILLALVWIALLDRTVLASEGKRPLDHYGRALGLLQRAVMIFFIAATATFGTVGAKQFIYFQF